MLGLSCNGDDPPPAPPPDPECGNGLLEDGETCEGLPMAPTGCDRNTCTVRPGWTCTPEPPSGDGETSGGGTEPPEWMSVCEELNTCEDGVLDVGEQCDDGNAVVMDGCSGCRVDPLYTCEGQPSECHTCGDGFRNDDEQCDDGELIDQDSPGCLNCMVVEGWECFPGQGQFDLCGPLCGDGRWFDTSIDGVTPGFAEGCDDGNLEDGDGCDSSCNVEDGWVCESTAPDPSECTIPEASTGGSSDGGGSSGTGSTG